MEYNYYQSHGQVYHFDPMQSQVFAEEQGRMDMNMIDPSLLPEGMEYFQLGHPMQVQKFLGEPERAWFSMPQFTQPHIGFPKLHEAQATLPYVRDYPVHSPSSTESSSAVSPRPESELLQDNYYHHQSFGASSPLSRSVSHISHGPQDLWPSSVAPAPFNGVISLSDLQGIPDPQEVTFQDDEGYAYMNDKESTIEVDTSGKSHRRGHYRYKSDSAIGQSIKGDDDDESTIVVVKRNSVVDEDNDADADADADAEEIIEPAAAGDEADPDFSPRSSRASKRKRTSTARSPIQAPSKRQKTSPNAPGSNKNKCPSCSSTFKDAAALTKHVSVAHTRPYVCTFAFAGCGSTFGNKNEWKRHVASQHLGLRVWVCTVGACAAKDAEFNRKDLFTQHLRRMHAPFKVKRQNKGDAKWDAEVRDLQHSSETVIRDPPTKTRCPVVGCESLFEGPSGWDERMEHVGRHLEGAGNDKVVVTEQGDEFLMDWALEEGIICRGPRGSFAFLGNSAAKTADEDTDADAEGEYV